MNLTLHAEKSILVALLNADSDPMSLTGLKLMSNCYDMEQLHAIVQRLCLQQLVTMRSLSDSINGDCTVYYIGRRQKELAKEHLAKISVNTESSGPLSETEKRILKTLLKSEIALTAKQINEVCSIGPQQMVWRLQVLTRNEWISSKANQVGAGRLYFLNEEQSISASIENEDEGLALYAQRNLREAVNDISSELVQSQAQRRELYEQLRNINQEIRSERVQISSVKDEIKYKSEKLKTLQLSHERLQNTLGLPIGRAQNDPVLLAQRLSFLRKLKSRPALEPLSMLGQIIEDYEVALTLARGEQPIFKKRQAF